MPGLSRSVSARAFHVIAKPKGALCNIRCAYCFYLEKKDLYARDAALCMDDAVVESFIRQYAECQGGPELHFSWQGGEPTLLPIDFFRRVLELQRKYCQPEVKVVNAIQTNGTLLNEDWASFFADNGFLVGLSLDGPPGLHDRYRVGVGGRPTCRQVLSGLQLLQEHGVDLNVLCTVNRANGDHPLSVYRFFRERGLRHLQFIPVVEYLEESRVSPRSVRPAQLGKFLCAVFDEWISRDVGEVFVQSFDMALASWMGMNAPLCVVREACGDVLALEHNGDLYSCDHFVRPSHKLGNIMETPLPQLAGRLPQLRFGDAKWRDLPALCDKCDVLFACRGGCPKDRLSSTQGESYLCAGYRAFFRHIDGPMQVMAAARQRGDAAAVVMDELRKGGAGRNDPCHCGSGRKHKACCLDGG